MKIPTAQKAVYGGSLILVNGRRPYHASACTRRLVPADGDNRDVLLDTHAAVMFQALMNKLGAWGQIVAVSGWRSGEEQARLYENSVRENGVAFTKQYVAAPGHSEHQTGLAIDLALAGPDIDLIRPRFPGSGICGLFRRLAATYGFIERYPAGKEHITGIAHEPWHFRYVGIPHGQIIERSGLCLEEYLALLRQWPYGTKPMRHQGRHSFDIFFLPVDGPTASLPALGEDAPYTVSGNNQDGLIVTVWRG